MKAVYRIGLSLLLTIASNSNMIAVPYHNMATDTLRYDSTATKAVEAVTEEAPRHIDSIFEPIEEVPRPIGGMKAYMDYINSALRYPKKALRKSISGRVFVEFLVHKDGSLSDFKVLRGIGHSCDKEAIRLIKEGPKWRHGKHRGIPERIKMVMPVTFRLQPSKHKSH